MVRLERLTKVNLEYLIKRFTFQYGQIRKSSGLHCIKSPFIAFTFQYGQIRKRLFSSWFWFKFFIYIPVWLDQKDFVVVLIITLLLHLHSSMVRLESPRTYLRWIRVVIFTFQYGQIRKICLSFEICWHCRIYIPVWLDQKDILGILCLLTPDYLHSSMVRLEREIETKDITVLNLFTFQYGQIRKQINILIILQSIKNLHSSMVRLESAFILDINIK